MRRWVIKNRKGQYFSCNKWDIRNLLYRDYYTNDPQKALLYHTKAEARDCMRDNDSEIVVPAEVTIKLV